MFALIRDSWLFRPIVVGVGHVGCEERGLVVDRFWGDDHSKDVVPVLIQQDTNRQNVRVRTDIIGLELR